VIEGGRGLCWGRNDHGEVGDGTTEDRGDVVEVSDSPGHIGHSNFAIAAGTSHTCAEFSESLRDTAGVWQHRDSIRCWGSNAAGQLGDRTRIDRETPAIAYQMPDMPGARFQSIGAGADHTCAIVQSSGESSCSSSVLGGSRCESGTISTLVCWGSNRYGQLGDGTTTDRDAPTVVHRSVHRTAD
jgi:alpha-tubulin suppressor-like RCC1 family protein